MASAKWPGNFITDEERILNFLHQQIHHHGMQMCSQPKGVKLCLYSWSKSGSRVFLAKERPEKGWDLPGGKFAEREITSYLNGTDPQKPDFVLLRGMVFRCLFRELQEEIGLTFGLKAIAPSLRLSLSTESENAWAVVVPMWVEPSCAFLPDLGLKAFMPNDFFANIFDVYQHVFRIFGHIATWRRTQLTQRVVPHFPPTHEGKPVEDCGFFALPVPGGIDFAIFPAPVDPLRVVGVTLSVETEIGSQYYDMARGRNSKSHDFETSASLKHWKNVSRSLPRTLEIRRSDDHLRMLAKGSQNELTVSAPVRNREPEATPTPRQQHEETDEDLVEEWAYGGDHEYRTVEDARYIGIDAVRAEVEEARRRRGAQNNSP